MTGCVVALDVGGTTIKGAVVDHDAAVLSRRRRRRRPRHRAGRGPGRDPGHGRRARGGGAGRRRPRGRAGGHRHRRRAAGIAVHSENVGWRDVPVRSLVEQATGPVGFGHDVRAGAVAEWRLGAGRGSRTWSSSRSGRASRPASSSRGGSSPAAGTPARLATSTWATGSGAPAEGEAASRPSPPPPPWPAATRASPGSRSPAPGRWRSGWSPATRRHAGLGRRDQGAGAGPGLDDRRAGAAGDRPRRGWPDPATCSSSRSVTSWRAIWAWSRRRGCCPPAWATRPAASAPPSSPGTPPGGRERRHDPHRHPQRRPRHHLPGRPAPPRVQPPCAGGGGTGRWQGRQRRQGPARPGPRHHGPGVRRRGGGRHHHRRPRPSRAGPGAHRGRGPDETVGGRGGRRPRRGDAVQRAGPSGVAASWDRLEALLAARLPDAEALVVAGSLPPAPTATRAPGWCAWPPLGGSWSWSTPPGRPSSGPPRPVPTS